MQALTQLVQRGEGGEVEVWRRLQFGASPEQLSRDQQLEKFWSLTK